TGGRRSAGSPITFLVRRPRPLARAPARGILRMGHEFVFPLIGGGLIGLGATLLLFSHGKVAGVSGLIEQAVTSPRADRGVAAWFLGGLLLAGLLSRVISPEALPAPARSLTFLLVAGTMVGLGTRLSRGCTSGHGIF